MRITALERQPRRRRVNLHLDGSQSLVLSVEICVQFGLRVGDQLSTDRLAEISDAEARHTALKSALRLLAYRPRSEAELRARLARKGVSDATLETTVARMRELNLVNDSEFARLFVESRDRTSPRSRRNIAAELRSKGVDRGIVSQSVSTLVDEDAAWRAAARRAPSLASLPYQGYRRRLADFLLRRGFDHETVRLTVARACVEAGHREPLVDDDGPFDG